MSNKDSLICAYLLDGKGGGTQVGWNEIDVWEPGQGNLWVHLDFTKATSQKWLQKEAKIDTHSATALFAEESRPRSVVMENAIYLCLRGVNTNPGDDPEDMVSIRIYLTSERIITTRRRKLLSVQDLRHAIENGVGPKNTTELMMMLHDRISARIAEFIEKKDDELDLIEAELLVRESHSLRPKLAELRRQVTLIRRYIAPQREALLQLQIAATPFLGGQVKLHLRESTDRLIRMVEDLDAIRDRGVITQEELSSRLTEQLDQRMYALSIVSLIFLPLTFITGLLGINTGGIPGANNELGFIHTCLILFAIGLMTVIALKWKKWL